MGPFVASCLGARFLLPTAFRGITAYGLHRPQRSRQKPVPHVPLPKQCVLSMHRSPARGPGPVHVFMHLDPAP